MTFFELAKSRWSVRSYKDTPIEDEKMKLILEAGRVAPTAKNYQPQRIYIAKSEEARQKLRRFITRTSALPATRSSPPSRRRWCSIRWVAWK